MSSKDLMGYRVDEAVVVRMPLAPAPTSAACEEAPADLDRSRDRLRTLLADPAVSDAIFVASPELFESLQEWEREPDSPRGRKTEQALVRYLARMTQRATPFGLFAGVAAGTLGDATSIVVGSRANHQRKTRLDNDYLFSLGEQLATDPEIRAALTWYPNSSAYEAAGRLRYAEARVAGRHRSYHLVAVDRTDYLARTLERASGGARLEALALGLCDDDPDVSKTEALEFLDELVNAQVIVSGLQPAVTGPDPLAHMISILKDAGDAGARVASVLSEAHGMIAAIDADGIGVDPERYRAVAATLERLPTKVDIARLFQVDMVKPATVTINRSVATEVARGIELMRTMTRRFERTAMSEFREAFAARYEDREIPLVDVLDEETGIGFDSSNGVASQAEPLLDGIAFPAMGREPSEPWGARERHLLELLQSAARSGSRAIELTNDDVAALAVPSPAQLPDALAAIVTVAASSAADVDAGRYHVFLDGAGGPSGARLSGRFCHASAEIERGVQAHVRAEEGCRPDAVFAEVAHLPEGRIGNILCRPVLRDYEIPFLGVSGAAADRQIPIQDLLVSVRHGRVVLRSKRLGREVIPRLSSAHNFRFGSLGVYKFLCALQGQGGSGANWSWGALSSAKFLPRVTHGRLVFSRARWTLDRSDLEPLAKAMKGAKQAKTPEQVCALRDRVAQAVTDMRERLGLPRLVVLEDGDNALTIDLADPIAADSFAQLVKERPTATLCELFPGPDQLVASGAEGRFAHELVLSYVKRSERSHDVAHRLSPVSSPDDVPSTISTARSFAPGSQWLYAKLYCGSATADDVLREVVGPVARAAMEGGAAKQWFFLRYGDPDWHVRVRFRGPAHRLCGEVLPLLHARAESLLGTGAMHRLALDTYSREIERYGGPEGMELFEALSHVDSEAVLSIVDLLDGDAGQDARWRLALRGADQLLDDLGFDLEGKLAIMTRGRASLGQEFGTGAAFGKLLGKKFRAERDVLETLVARNAERDATSDLEPGFAILTKRSARLQPIAAELRNLDRAGRLSPRLEDVAWSYVHMHVNRLLRSVHRAQEVVLYDLLKRIYQARHARSTRSAPRAALVG